MLPSGERARIISAALDARQIIRNASRSDVGIWSGSIEYLSDGSDDEGSRACLDSIPTRFEIMAIVPLDARPRLATRVALAAPDYFTRQISAVRKAISGLLSMPEPTVTVTERDSLSLP